MIPLITQDSAIELAHKGNFALATFIAGKLNEELIRPVERTSFIVDLIRRKTRIQNGEKTNPILSTKYPGMTHVVVSRYTHGLPLCMALEGTFSTPDSDHERHF